MDEDMFFHYDDENDEEKPAMSKGALVAALSMAYCVIGLLVLVVAIVTS